MTRMLPIESEETLIYPDLFGLPMRPWPAQTLADVAAFKLSPRYRSIERAEQRQLQLMLSDVTDGAGGADERRPVPKVCNWFRCERCQEALPLDQMSESDDPVLCKLCYNYCIDMTAVTEKRASVKQS